MATHHDLYRRFGHEVVRFASSLVGVDEAQDIVHDAMTSLMASNALATAENPRALMYRAVLAKAHSDHRSRFRRRRRERMFANGIVVADPEVLPEVARAVARLSPQQRACVFLTYWEDMTPGQISAYLSIAEGTVKQHLARGRDRLREVLRD